MRRLGMQPVLPAFAGFVPDAFVTRHQQVSCSLHGVRALRSCVYTGTHLPVAHGFAGLESARPTTTACCDRRCAWRHCRQAATRRLQPWAGMPCRFSCSYTLDPQDPLFQEVGTAFIQVPLCSCSRTLAPDPPCRRKTHAIFSVMRGCSGDSFGIEPLVVPHQELRAEYGHDTVGWYSADTFNENVSPSSEPAYLRATSAAIYKVNERELLHACLMMLCCQAVVGSSSCWPVTAILSSTYA